MSADPTPLRVAVLATPLARRALAAGLAEHGLDVVADGELSDPDARRRAAHADVVVLSAGDLPDPAAVPALADHVGAAALVVGDTDADQLERAMRAGAAGFVDWERPLAQIAEAARTVARGETVVPPGMLGGLLQRLIERRRSADQALARLATLTARERQVLALLCDGHDVPAIARELVITPQTARSHLSHVLSRLEVHSRLEAVALVRDHDLRASLDAMEVTA